MMRTAVFSTVLIFCGLRRLLRRFGEAVFIRAPARPADQPPCALAYLLSGYRRSAVSCSQLAAVIPSGHLRRAAAVRLIVASAWMPLASSPIQTLMPAS